MIRRIARERALCDGDLWDFALWAMLTHRFAARLLRLPRGPRRWIGFRIHGVLAKVVEAVSNIWIGVHAEIGEGVHLVHSGNVKIHDHVQIGAGTSIMHEVTIGENMGREGVPQIGAGCLIGAGAKVLGGVTVGDGATVAANSLVITDVPAGATAVGVPARVLPGSAKANEGGAKLSIVS